MTRDWTFGGMVYVCLIVILVVGLLGGWAVSHA